ncbi:MAG: SRPBCC domain-containing protein, partial [Spirochaetia bacterium]|nr:SRPBCC domain-containing protein [Spirochaetia bacterium]
MTIKHLFHIKSPRENVFREIATTEGLSHWWTVTTGGESRVGGVLTFKFGQHEGPKLKVTKLVENKEVAWECVEGPSD